MSYNKIIIIGNLGSDPTTREVGENSVTSFSVASSEKYQGTEKTTWYRVSAWNKLGNLCSEYLKKGSKVYVEGRHFTSEYTDKDGVLRTTNEVRLSDIQFLTPKSEGKAASAGAVSSAADDDDSDVPF